MKTKHMVVGIVFVLFVIGAVLIAVFGFGGYPSYGWVKMALATGYLFAAVAMGALGSRLGSWLLAGFACAWWGDFFLIGPGNGFFLAGLVAFLMGHLCYCIACARYGSRAGFAAVVCLVLSGPGGVLVWLLWAGIPRGLGVPVILYVCVITLMVSLAVACVGRPAGWLLAVGAVLFYLSDIGVSAHAFGGARMEPFRWFVALYFPGQYVLAAAIPVSRRGLAKNSAKLGMNAGRP